MMAFFLTSNNSYYATNLKKSSKYAGITNQKAGAFLRCS